MASLSVPRTNVTISTTRLPFHVIKKMDEYVEDQGSFVARNHQNQGRGFWDLRSSSYLSDSSFPDL